MRGRPCARRRRPTHVNARDFLGRAAGNSERQCYGDNSNNVRVDASADGADGGVLTITATHSPTAFTCGRTTNLNWRSARINTRNKKVFRWRDDSTPIKVSGEG